MDTFDVTSAAQGAPVPAFIIQPLVENAVRHGMKDEGALHIAVRASVPEEGTVLIEVADDGAGMDGQTAARLFDEREEAPDHTSPQGGGAGVAMHNISERIRRFYGPRSRAHVESEVGRGTTVSFKLDLENSILGQRGVE